MKKDNLSNILAEIIYDDIINKDYNRFLYYKKKFNLNQELFNIEFEVFKIFDNVTTRLYNDISKFKSKDSSYSIFLNENYESFKVEFDFLYKYSYILFFKYHLQKKYGIIELKVAYMVFVAEFKKEYTKTIPFDLTNLDNFNDEFIKHFNNEDFIFYNNKKNKLNKICDLEEFENLRHIYIKEKDNNMFKTQFKNAGYSKVMIYENLSQVEIDMQRITKMKENHNQTELCFNLNNILNLMHELGFQYEFFFNTFNIDIFDLKEIDLKKLISKNMFKELKILFQIETPYPLIVIIGAFLYYSGAIKINNNEYKDGEIPANLFYQRAKYYLK